MSKRRAENQLTKDDSMDNEVEEIDETGFKAADVNVLATRKIKPLPKRGDMLGVTPSLPAPPAGGRFAGFGSFGATTTTTTTSTSTFPALPAPSNAFGNSKTTNGTSFIAPPPLTPAPTEPIIEDDDPNLLKNFRGLNQTFVQIVRQELKTDPFVDISALLTRYQSCRNTIKKTASYASFTKFEPPPSWNTSGQKKPEPKKASPPKKPPNPIFDFGAPPAPVGGAFQFAPSTFKSNFTSSSGPASTTTKPDESWKAKPTTAKDADSKFAFTPIFPSPPKSTSNPFGTATSSTSTAKPSEEAPKSTTANSFLPPTSSTGFVFGTTSGPGATPAPAKGGFTFGTSSTNTFGSTAPTTAPQKSAPLSPSGSTSQVGFTFGTSKEDKADPVNAVSTTALEQAKPTGFAAFGTFGGSKPAESSSFFKFGSSSSTDNVFGSSKPTSLVPTPSGALTPSFTPAISREDTPQSEAVTEGTNGESAADEPQPTDDDVYEGEENETTLHSVKAKVSKLVTNEGKSEWSTMGVGLFRVKRHNESNVLRILHRDTASRRIIINARLFKAMSLTVAGAKMLKLGLIENNKPAQYLIRVALEQDCKDLKTTIDDQLATLE